MKASVRIAAANPVFRSTLDTLCPGHNSAVNLRLMAATFQAYPASRPSLAVNSTAVSDAAERHSEDYFYVGVRSRGLSPAQSC